MKADLDAAIRNAPDFRAQALSQRAQDRRCAAVRAGHPELDRRADQKPLGKLEGHVLGALRRGGLVAAGFGQRRLLLFQPGSDYRRAKDDAKNDPNEDAD